ncbi:phosphotransferase [Neosynechococcus sphagnicola sy1]|uniref:Phosphotransferase n=1 Tax=Neosynechococcus sphagnicola sy1 TaxID=1497020 RepID=A0A098TMN5_9CYAN|nr:PHP domain-containing protein [Neosynechococcus sphagnicola]KGF73546.1 phosphotransferase [Neosynechococcus sphagnicola sy1]
MTAYFAQVVSAQPAAQDSLALRRIFQDIQADSCPRSFNFHLHTHCSDGQLTPEQLIQQAIALGLQGLAITDHHSTRGYQRAQDYLCHHRELWQRQPNKFELPQLWTGVEITALLGKTEVHILGYAFNPEHPALLPYLQGEAPDGNAAFASSVIRAIHLAGGLAILAHPARYRRSPQELIAEAAHLEIDGVETYYAYNNPLPWQPSPDKTSLVKGLALTYRLLNTCGTDTHGLNILQRL